MSGVKFIIIDMYNNSNARDLARAEYVNKNKWNPKIWVS